MKKTFFAFLFFTSALFSQNKFYNYYTSGLEYMEKQDWQRAITELQSAASLEFEDVQRKRTYGTRFIEYYPHREIGIAHYMLGEIDFAKKELELSLAYRQSDRAVEYSSKISGGVKPAPIVKVEKKPEVVVNQPKASEIKKEQTPVTLPTTTNPTVTAPAKTSIFVVTKKYDPNNSTQVGSRLAIAVLPFDGGKEVARYKDAVTNEMIDQLVNLRRFKVIERSSMDKIVAEQKIQASGFVDDKSAVKLGKIAGADALVIGNIIFSGTSIKISARLVDVETAETLISEDAVSENISQESIDGAVANVATMLYNELPIIEGDIIKVDP
jgi:TolB-like protein